MIELMVQYGELMTTKTDRVKVEFAKRLHDAMDKKGYPVRGRARVLSKEFQISDKGAGKWLNGESIPETSKIPLIAKFLDVKSEWLISGNEEITKFSDNNLIQSNTLRSLEKEYNVKELEDFINQLELLDKKKSLTLETLLLLRQTLKLITNHN